MSELERDQSQDAQRESGRPRKVPLTARPLLRESLRRGGLPQSSRPSRESERDLARRLEDVRERLVRIEATLDQRQSNA